VLFVDFLRITVLLSAASATGLAALTVVGANSGDHPNVALMAAAWWAVAALIGLLLGRRHEVNPPIARLLSAAKSVKALSEPRPGLILINRLWPLLLASLSAGAIAFVAPQVSGIGAGFAIIWALSWRRQDAAVLAIEERDGIEFHVERTSPVRPMRLLRITGFKTIHPQRVNGTV
jgi:hypothetical protein